MAGRWSGHSPARKGRRSAADPEPIPTPRRGDTLIQVRHATEVIQAQTSRVLIVKNVLFFTFDIQVFWPYFQENP
jgi:hypothetical protein